MVLISVRYILLLAYFTPTGFKISRGVALAAPCPVEIKIHLCDKKRTRLRYNATPAITNHPAISQPPLRYRRCLRYRSPPCDIAGACDSAASPAISQGAAISHPPAISQVPAISQPHLRYRRCLQYRSPPCDIAGTCDIAAPPAISQGLAISQPHLRYRDRKSVV